MTQRKYLYTQMQKKKCILYCIQSHIFIFFKKFNLIFMYYKRDEFTNDRWQDFYQQSNMYSNK